MDLPPQPQLSCKYPHAMDRFPSTSSQTQGQKLVLQDPKLSRHLGSTWITWPSNIRSGAVNGSILHPVGNLPHVAFCVNSRTVHDDVHIYDLIAGALISWAIAKHLGILPECYPEPARQIHAMHTHHNISNPLLTSDQIMAEFPSVFDGQIHMIPREQFHISLTEDARPLSV